MLSAFAAEKQPLKETVSELEDYCKLFIENICLDSFELAKKNGESRVKSYHLMKVVEPNKKCFLRIPFLLTQWKDKAKFKQAMKH
jgi:hypothetical protein